MVEYTNGRFTDATDSAYTNGRFTDATDSGEKRMKRAILEMTRSGRTSEPGHSRFSTIERVISGSATMLWPQSDDRVKEADDEAQAEFTDSGDGVGDGQRVKTFSEDPYGSLDADYEDEGNLADAEDSDDTDVDTPNVSEISEAGHEYKACKYSICRRCVLPTQQHRTLTCHLLKDRPTKAEKQEASPYAALRATPRVPYDIPRYLLLLRDPSCDLKDAHFDRNVFISELVESMKLSSEEAEVLAQSKDLDIAD